MADVNKTVQITYNASTKGLEQSLKKIPKITDANGRKAASSIDENFRKMERSADRAAKNISQKMKKAGKALSMLGGATIAVGGGVIALQQKMADLSNELVDASTKTGIAVDTLAGLRLAAEGSGLSFSALEGGLIRFQGSMDQANKGSKNLSEAFSKLGVNVKKSNGELRDSDEVFNEVVAQLGAMENLTERNATAMLLFGRSAGPALIQSGALENLDQMTQFTQEFGIALNDHAIGGMADFQRVMAEFQTVAIGTFNDLISSVAGPDGITHLIHGLSEAFVFLGSVAGDVISFIGQGFENMFGLIEAGMLLMSGDVGLAGELMKQLENDTRLVATNISTTFDRASAKVSTFNELSSTSEAPKMLKATGAAAKATTTEVEDLTEAVESLNEVTEELKFNEEAWTTLMAIGDQLDQAFTEPLDKATEAFQNNQRELKKIIDETNRLLIEVFETPRADRSEEQMSEILRLLHIRGAAEEELFRNQMAYEKELAEVRKQNQLDLAAGAVETFGHATDVIKAFNEKEIQEMEEHYQNHLDFVDKMVKQGKMTAEEGARSKEAAEEHYYEKISELAIKNFRLEQAAATADVIFQGAIATTRAFADYGPTPAGVAAAAFAAAATGAQLATIAAQSPPKFDVGGMVGSSDPGAPDQVNASLLTGEAVLDRSTVRALGGEQGIRQLQNGNGTDNIVVIQPFKHIDRYNRSMKRRSPSRVGSGGY